MKYQCPKNRKVKLSLERARVLLQEHSDLTEYYICNVCWHYHLTSYEVTPRKNRQNTFEITRIQREMKYEAAIMATRKELVIAFLKDIYRKDGIYKVTNEEIRQLLDETSPGIDKQAVSALTSTMKKEGLLMNLDETTPNKGTRGGGPPARYFALSSIINEMTKPSNKDKDSKMTEAPKPKPSVTPAVNTLNLMNKVSARIEVINNDLTKSINTLRQEVSHNKASDVAMFDAVNNRLETLVEALTKLAQTYNSDHIDKNMVDTKAVVNQLMDLQDGNSLVYQIRDTIAKSMLDYSNTMERDGSEDYKRGVKDGIALAIEMGLKTRE